MKYSRNHPWNSFAKIVTKSTENEHKSCSLGLYFDLHYVWNKTCFEWASSLEHYHDPMSFLSHKAGPAIRHCHKTDFDVTTRQCVVLDRNLACPILVRRKTLSDGGVKICLLP